ncbi:MAG TPA: HDOD domain-containing protein [Burkholderiaceae bacterium]
MPTFLKDIEAGRVALPMIPRIVHRLIAALCEREVDYRKLSKALARDPVLSAKVLRLANSSLFGGPRSTASIDAAVRMVGAEVLNKVIATNLGAIGLEAIAGIDLRLFWHDALVTAVAANKLALLVGADPEEAYLCGLLHTSGHLVLCRCYPDIADAMFSGFKPMRGARLAAVEKDAFGTDHAAAGALWIDSLDFPKAIVEVVRTQLTTPVDEMSPLALALRSGRLLATSVAHKEAALAALGKLAPALRDRFTTDDGRIDPGFLKFYAALGDIKAKG